MYGRSAFVVASFVVAAAVPAGAAPIFDRPAAQRTDLSEHIGKTFLQTLLTPIVGLDAEMDAEVYKPVKMVPGADMVTAIRTFDPNVAKVFDYFPDKQAGFLKAVADFEGKDIVPGQFRELLRSVTLPLVTDPKVAGAANGSTSGLALLISGSGTLVIMDDNNYFYNVGYQDDNITTGRSYAVSGPRLLLDATHREYLVDLQRYVKDEGGAAFFKVFMETLTATDLRGLGGLSDKGQAVMADFLAVYVAELERHEMAGLGTRAPWGIDLAEVTLLSGYVAAANMAMKNGNFVSGGSEVWAEKGSIGNVKGELMRLGKLMTAYLLDPFNSPQLVDRIVDLTPIPDAKLADEIDGDIFRRILVYLNMRATQKDAQANAAELTAATLALLQHLTDDQVKITEFIRGCMKDPETSFSCRAAKPPTVANILVHPQDGTLVLLN